MRLIEHYLSLQGEGLRAGRLTYFVRFAGCNLRCTWCDSAFTFGRGTETGFETVAAAIRESRARYVCLTGGEPLLHVPDCLRLIRRFPGLHFDIETGGSLSVEPVRKRNTSLIVDWKLKNSAMGRRMNAGNLTLLRPGQDLLKLVTDGSEAEKEEILRIAEKTASRRIPLSIQPVYPTQSPPSSKNRVRDRAHIRKIAEWLIALKNPRFQFNLQTHKHVWNRDRRGV